MVGAAIGMFLGWLWWHFAEWWNEYNFPPIKGLHLLSVLGLVALPMALAYQIAKGHFEERNRKLEAEIEKMREEL